MKALIIVLKIVVVLLGSVMLVGGTFCGVSNIFFAVESGLGRNLSLFAILFCISAAVAAVGWVLLKVAGTGKLLGFRPPEPTKPNDSAKEERAPRTREDAR